MYSPFSVTLIISHFRILVNPLAQKSNQKVEKDTKNLPITGEKKLFNVFGSYLSSGIG